MPSFRAQPGNPPCTLFFLAPFAEGFQFYFVTHTTLYRCARKIEGFARDDVAWIPFSKHIRCTLREINPFPPYRHFEHSEKSSLHSALSCSFRKMVPLFRCHTYDAIPVCKKDPSASLGMTLRKRRFPNISFIRDVGYLFPPYRHFERSEKSSLHSALSCSFRKMVPLFRAFLFPS